ncbi:MAG: hypothetical protein U0K38_01540 [Collinsella sp.]|nr:hypothetical protein [Collinsella sp.]
MAAFSKNSKLFTCGFIFANYGMVEDTRLNVVDSRISWRTVRFKAQDSLLRTAILEVAVE